MRVFNVHERELAASAAAVGALLDSLALPGDKLWPRATWPAMRLDRALGAGAVGGHGPIRYRVEEYRPGEMIRFHFLAPRGFDGSHCFEVVAKDPGATLLRHTIEMRTTGAALITWPLVIRPLHDALLEDALALAEAASGQSPTIRRWSRWVRFLRWCLSRGRALPQQRLIRSEPDRFPAG